MLCIKLTWNATDSDFDVAISADGHDRSVPPLQAITDLLLILHNKNSTFLKACIEVAKVYDKSIVDLALQKAADEIKISLTEISNVILSEIPAAPHLVVSSTAVGANLNENY